MAANSHGELLRTPSVWHPSSPGEAWRLKRELADEAVFVAGGTLLRTQWEAGIAPYPAHLIDLTRIDALRGVWPAAGDSGGSGENSGENSGGFSIGALTALADCRGDDGLAEAYPLIPEAARVIAAPAVRNLATIGGNVLSRTGDMVTALLALDASLLWLGAGGERSEPLADWLQRERTGTLVTSELLLAVVLPAVASAGVSSISNARRVSAFHKVGRREAFSPSLLNVAMLATLGDDGTVLDLALAAGGGAMLPVRLTEAERLALGRRPDAALLGELHAAVLAAYAPQPDLFVGADYRRMTAANLASAALWQASEDDAGGSRREGVSCC